MPRLTEYRITLPMQLSDYELAQRYMVSRFSRQHTEEEAARGGDGAEGVEVLVEEARTADEEMPHDYKYSHKIIHLGRNLPGYVRALLPATALEIHEKSWNAYPHRSRSEYSSPYLADRFSLVITTVYRDCDAGSVPNPLQLDDADLKLRVIDHIDIRNDYIAPDKYIAEEDPATFVPKNGDGKALDEDWLTQLQEAWPYESPSDTEGDDDDESESSASASSGTPSRRKKKGGSKKKKGGKGAAGRPAGRLPGFGRPPPTDGTSMDGDAARAGKPPCFTAYKLARAQVNVWGIGGKAEQWILKNFTRDVLFLSHRQAYAWTDEWSSMTKEDVIAYEAETKRITNALVGNGGIDEDHCSAEDKKAAKTGKGGKKEEKGAAAAGADE